MDILVVGSGGREHAIVRKLNESSQTDRIYCAPGNGGIACEAQCVDIDAMDAEGIIRFAKEKAIDLVFVAPDDPLACGMVDRLEAAGIQAFGPDQKAAMIESSKVFSKNLMKKYHIPTARYEVFDDAAAAQAYVRAGNQFPIVVKADGLAVGKGAIVAEDEAAAFAAIQQIMCDKVFGESGNRIVIEEFMQGPEVSVLAFTDGKTMKPMVSAKDHKRAHDGDRGLNTGGMGTISPNPHYDSEMAKRCMKEIFLPTMEAMNKERRTFKGCLFFGLMLTEEGPKVIEYNARFGDPEAQVVLPRLKTDLVDIITAVRSGRLNEVDIEWAEESCACVVLASGGYPTAYEKGKRIDGLDARGQVPGATVYHSGTRQEKGLFLTNGGRVLGVTAKGTTLAAALDQAYQSIQLIDFEGAFYRTDIGRTEG